MNAISDVGRRRVNIFRSISMRIKTLVQIFGALKVFRFPLTKLFNEIIEKSAFKIQLFIYSFLFSNSRDLLVLRVFRDQSTGVKRTRCTRSSTRVPTLLWIQRSRWILDTSMISVSSDGRTGGCKVVLETRYSAATVWNTSMDVTKRGPAGWACLQPIPFSHRRNLRRSRNNYSGKETNNVSSWYKSWYFLVDYVLWI